MGSVQGVCVYKGSPLHHLTAPQHGGQWGRGGGSVRGGSVAEAAAPSGQLASGGRRGGTSTVSTWFRRNSVARGIGDPESVYGPRACAYEKAFSMRMGTDLVPGALDGTSTVVLAFSIS